MSILDGILDCVRRSLGIVSTSRVFMQKIPQIPPLTYPPLKIAFLAWGLAAADRYLEQLVADNDDQVKRYILRHTVILTDGTEISRISVSDPSALRGRRFDQVIIADDRRMQILERRQPELHELARCCAGSIIPEEFRFQIYDLDEEDPNHGKT